jgi:hypothetical protein
MDGVLLLIPGASGAGKTSVRNAIAPDLAWRQRMAERAVRRAAALDMCGRRLLLAGNPVAPGEVLAAPSAPSVDIAVCLLDVAEHAQRERLRRRGDPEELPPHHVAFADWLRAMRQIPHTCRTS